MNLVFHIYEDGSEINNFLILRFYHIFCLQWVDFGARRKLEYLEENWSTRRKILEAHEGLITTPVLAYVFQW